MVQAQQEAQRQAQQEAQRQAQQEAQRQAQKIIEDQVRDKLKEERYIEEQFRRLDSSGVTKLERLRTEVEFVANGVPSAEDVEEQLALSRLSSVPTGMVNQPASRIGARVLEHPITDTGKIKFS